MEKKYILVGMHNRRLAFDFMNSVIHSLDSESIAITHHDYYPHRLGTAHTEVWFVCGTDRTDKLLGIPHADAIFGITYVALLARAKPNAVIAERDHVGLVDYICKIEREAKPLVFTELQKNMVCAVLSMHIRDKHIPAAIQRAYDYNRDQVRLEIQHLHKPDTAIHIIWDEVTDICECLRAVKNKLDEWVIDKSVWITTASPYHNDAWKNLRDSMRGGYTYAKPEFRVEHVCDKDIREMYPKTMIMAGRQNGKSLYRHVLNAVYGKSPTEANYMTQMAIYAALMKGENNMPAHTITNPECAEYCRKDVETTTTFAKALQEIWRRKARKDIFAIKKVYFNDPVTVVIWEDGTKTVVRCNNDQYDPEKGLAMAIAKKALGTNKSGSNYYDAFKKWLPKTEEESVEETEETNVEEQK